MQKNLDVMGNTAPVSAPQHLAESVIQRERKNEATENSRCALVGCCFDLRFIFETNVDPTYLTVGFDSTTILAIAVGRRIGILLFVNTSTSMFFQRKTATMNPLCSLLSYCLTLRPVTTNAALFP